MNRRQKIIVSVTGIFLVLLILMGLTYAYFLTRINGNPNDTSISIKTARLELTYADGNGELLVAEPIKPGVAPGNVVKFLTEDDEITEEKTFSVENNGTSSTSYAVVIDNFNITYTNNATFTVNGEQKTVNAGDETSFVYPEDFKFEIVCESTEDSCNGIRLEDNKHFTNTNDVLLQNEIKAGETQTYKLKIYYVDSGINQSDDMNKSFTGHIDIVDAKTISIEGEVANYVAGDFVQSNSTKRTSNIAYDSKEKVYKYKIVGLEPDDHTISVRNYDASNNEIVKSSKSISIVMGETQGISGTTLTVTEATKVATINLDSNSNNYTIEELVAGDYEKGTLAYAVMNNNAIPKKGTKNTFTEIVTDDEHGKMYNAQDDYGTSWYFRGLQENNYVNFAGLTWRIVRINGDGSVRLLLEYVLHADEVYGTQYADGSVINGTNNVKSGYNPSNIDNAYVGYMYGLPGTTTDANRCLVLENGVVVDKASTYKTKETCETANGKWTTTAYEATHANVINSYMKNTIDHFYEDYLLSNKDYLADIIFCNDKTIAPASISGVGLPNTQKGYGREITFYGAGARIVYEPNTDKGTILEAKPTFKCAVGADNDYSRFTVTSGMTSNGVKTNGDLTYPIGLLTADELVFAGLYKDQYTKDVYIINDYGTPGNYTNGPMTMTPGYLNSSGATATMLTVASANNTFSNIDPSKAASARPVINIKADVLVAGGNGTSSFPYTLKLAN